MFSLINNLPKSFFCIILISPSLVSSSDPEKSPHKPVFISLLFFLNREGISSEISHQSFNFFILDFIISTPCSVVQTGNFGIFIDKNLDYYFSEITQFEEWINHIVETKYNNQIQFVGVGGEEMEAQGLKSLFPMAELSIMGLVEVLPRAPRLYRRIFETTRMIRDMQPAAMVTIDSPGFTFRLVRRLGKLDVPRIHYVAPTV